MEHLTEYENYLYMQELADSTVRIYLEAARKFLAFAGDGPLDKSMTLKFKRHMESGGLAVSSVNQQIIALNRYLRFCGSEECMVKTRRIQKNPSLSNVIDGEEYRRMLNFAKESGDDKYYSIMKTLASTGIRISELSYFKADNIQAGHITVSNKGKVREIYLPDALVQLLSDYCQRHGIKEGCIFLGSAGNPISRIAVWQKLNRMAQKLGIDKSKSHPHSFRHYFALSYLEKYQNLFELADILGHTSLETTRIYARASVEEKRRRLEELTAE